MASRDWNTKAVTMGFPGVVQKTIKSHYRGLSIWVMVGKVYDFEAFLAAQCKIVNDAASAGNWEVTEGKEATIS